MFIAAHKNETNELNKDFVIYIYQMEKNITPPYLKNFIWSVLHLMHLRMTKEEF